MVNLGGVAMSYDVYLKDIDSQRDELVSTLLTWSNINSFTENQQGVDLMGTILEKSLVSLNVNVERTPLPPLSKINTEGHLTEIPLGQVLHFRKHETAPIKVLLSGHIDTVFPLDSPFQQAQIVDKNKIVGPGVADMKGGILVMLKSLEILEQSPLAGKIGWEVIINTDEEAGSRSSENLFRSAALRNDVGLVFEPAFPDGSMVKSRKGSANYTLVVRGKSAHAGRDFWEGRNAIIALVKILLELNLLNDPAKDVTLNTGFIAGGGPVNIVPNLAIAKINMRANSKEEFEETKQTLLSMIKEAQFKDIHIDFFCHGERTPKILDANHQKLFEYFNQCAKDLGLEFKWVSSGGVCDGSILAEAGLPTLDSLGVVGGGLHTSEEYMWIDSLFERIQLSALFLLKLANQEIILKKDFI